MFLALADILLLALLLECATSSSRVQVESRVRTGQSSYIRFPVEKQKHAEMLRFMADFSAPGREAARIPTIQSEKGEIASFLDSYGSYLGVTTAQLTEVRIDADEGSGCSFHRYQQTILGYPVFAGTIVVILGSHGGVVEAHGHAAFEADISAEYLSAQPLSTVQAQRVVREYFASVRSGVLCQDDHLAVATVWYRTELLHGRSGRVVLATHVSGRCTDSDNDDAEILFDLFGELLSFIYS
jgi:hypothetical protein